MSGKYPRALEVLISMCVAVLVTVIMLTFIYLLEAVHWFGMAFLITLLFAMVSLFIWAILFAPAEDYGPGG